MTDLQPGQEIKLHPASIINPGSVPPGLLHVRRYFRDRVFREVGQRSVEIMRYLTPRKVNAGLNNARILVMWTHLEHPIVKRPESGVAKS